MKKKVIVAGGRNFRDYEQLSATLNKHKDEISEIVCGEARGADSLGKRWGIENGIPIKSFPANWDAYGKAAGPIRNREMAEYADYLIAFWDNKSRGTYNMRNNEKIRKAWRGNNL